VIRGARDRLPRGGREGDPDIQVLSANLSRASLLACRPSQAPPPLDHGSRAGGRCSERESDQPPRGLSPRTLIDLRAPKAPVSLALWIGVSSNTAQPCGRNFAGRGGADFRSCLQAAQKLKERTNVTGPSVARWPAVLKSAGPGRTI